MEGGGGVAMISFPGWRRVIVEKHGVNIEFTNLYVCTYLTPTVDIYIRSITTSFLHPIHISENKKKFASQSLLRSSAEINLIDLRPNSFSTPPTGTFQPFSNADNFFIFEDLSK